MKSPPDILPSFLHATKPSILRGIGRPRIEVREAFAYILAFALVVVTVGGFLRWHIASLYEQEMASWRARQSSVADDQTQRVSDWLKERQGDARVFATRPSVRAVLRAHYAGELPAHYPSASLAESLVVLDEMAKSYSYAGVYILDRGGQVVMQSTQSIPLNPLLSDTWRAAFRSGVLQSTLVGDAPSLSLMGFSASVLPGPGGTDASSRSGQPLGIVLVVSDPSQTLFPLVTREAVPTRTGETLLVRREERDIVFFSPRRHVPASSPNPRVPLTTAPLPERLALEGRTTFAESSDYRGVPVLAATQRIPLTGWGLVHKIDRAEALQRYRRMVIAEGLAGGLLITLLGGLLLFHRRNVLNRVLKQEEEKFRALLESAPDAIYILDPSTLGILGRNRKAAELDGYSDEEIARMTVADLHPPGDHTLLREWLERGPEAGGVLPPHTLQHRRKDGRLVPVEENQTVVDAGNERLVLSIVRDITERKRVEGALIEQRHLFDSLMDNLPDVIYFKDRESRFTRISSALAKRFGLGDPARAEGKSDFDFFTPEHAQEAYNDEQVIMGTGQPVVGKEEKETWPDGRETWASSTKVPLRDPQGNIIGTFGASRDITEIKRAELQIRKLNDELEQRVLERTAELEAANKELEAFTYSVSHDLRAPLRHVDGFSKLLMEEHRAELSPDAQEYIETIRDAALQMGMLIDDLLNLARVGRKHLSMQVTGLNSLAEEVKADLERSNPERLIEWKIETLPFVECDPGLMKQVFANLLANAVKFTRPRKPAVIEVGAVRQDAHPVIFVRDNGVGFSMKYANKLFGVFQRLHRSEDFEGTGVGLATVQRIIHKHGGRVWAEAELDRGATFYFTLGSPDDSPPEKRTDSGGKP